MGSTRSPTSTGKSAESNRDTFFYYQGRLPSAVRYKNWKFYYTMMGSTGVDALNPPMTYHWTQLQNIMRDPFENNVGAEQKGAFSVGGALASPSTAYIYDWNLLPIGQLLWEKELMSYIDFPPLQLAASYNLETGPPTGAGDGCAPPEPIVDQPA